MEVAGGWFTWVGATVGTRVDMEVAVGWFTWEGATVAGKGEAGIVIWLGVQPENTPHKLATITRMVMKWYLVLGFNFSHPDDR